MKECFSCKHKISKELTIEEIVELQTKYIEFLEKKILFIPKLEFKCELTGIVIKQIDSACNNYSGNKVMEDIRKDISNTIKRLKERVNKIESY